jgi:hypothetical protein
MEMREEPHFVQFVTGEMIEGTLLARDRVQVKGQAGVRYTVKLDNGTLVAFLGTYQLNTKLRLDDLMHRVEIRSIGEDVMVKRGDNCMKVFEVKVSKDRVVAPSGDSPEITGDDLPF